MAEPGEKFVVVGVATIGVAPDPDEPPVRISGKSSDGFKRDIATDSSGNVATYSAGFATRTKTRPTGTSAASITIITASTTIRYAYISNNSGNIWYLELGAAAVVGQGIRLANNGIWEINGNNPWLGSVQAISSSATSSALDVFVGTP